MKQAQMIFHRRNDIKGSPEQVTVEWDGPKDGVAAVSYYFWDDLARSFSVKNNPQIGDMIAIGPYRLRVFKIENRRGEYLLIRQDSIVAHLRAVAYRLTRWLDLIYRRLIITAAVWRLANYHEAMIPSWRDLHIVKRFKKGS